MINHFSMSVKTNREMMRVLDRMVNLRAFSGGDAFRYGASTLKIKITNEQIEILNNKDNVPMACRPVLYPEMAEQSTINCEHDFITGFTGEKAKDKVTYSYQFEPNIGHNGKQLFGVVSHGLVSVKNEHGDEKEVTIEKTKSSEKKVKS